VCACVWPLRAMTNPTGELLLLKRLVIILWGITGTQDGFGFDERHLRCLGYCIIVGLSGLLMMTSWWISFAVLVSLLCCSLPCLDSKAAAVLRQEKRPLIKPGIDKQRPISNIKIKPIDRSVDSGKNNKLALIVRDKRSATQNSIEETEASSSDSAAAPSMLIFRNNPDRDSAKPQFSRLVAVRLSTQNSRTLECLSFAMTSEQQPDRYSITTSQLTVRDASVEGILAALSASDEENKGSEWEYVTASEIVYGVYQLPLGPHVAVVAESEHLQQCEQFRINGVRSVRHIKLLPVSHVNEDVNDDDKKAGHSVYELFLSNTSLSNSDDETSVEQIQDLRSRNRKMANLILSTLSRHSLYYSTGKCDFTRCAQSNSIQAGASWRHCDHRFFWNFNALKPLIEANCSDSWIFPMVNAVISGTSTIEVNTGHRRSECQMMLIARRGWQRQGQRYLCRGCNVEGHVANLVESEQLTRLDHETYSYAQVRK
jgi:hypothetical protein